MLSWEQTKNGCGSAQVLEAESAALAAQERPAGSEGVLANQGGLPTQVTTRGRGVLLFYRGGFATTLPQGRDLMIDSKSSIWSIN